MQANNQVDGALEYMSARGSEPVDVAAFDEAAGVGVEVSPQQVSAAVAEVVESSKPALIEQRYALNANVLLGQARVSCPQCNPHSMDLGRSFVIDTWNSRQGLCTAGKVCAQQAKSVHNPRTKRRDRHAFNGYNIHLLLWVGINCRERFHSGMNARNVYCC